MQAAKEAILALADGRIFRGRAFGAIGETVGEVVFNTAMTGYQEVLTDPSYKGQMVCMTYPEIGNVGINADDAESARVYVEGFIVKEYRARPSNWRSRDGARRISRACGCGRESRESIRARWCGTSALHGAQEAVISSVDLDPDALVAQGQSLAGTGRTRPGQGSHLRRAPTTGNVGDWELGRGYRHPSKRNCATRR